VAEIKQYVNLPKKQAYARASGQPLAALGARDVKVVTSHRGAPTVVKVEPLGDHPYSDDEQKRNPRFQPPRTTWVTAHVQGTQIDSGKVALPAAGGQRYQITAKYAGQQRSADDTLIAWRMIFAESLVMFSMEGDEDALIAQATETLRQHHVELKHVRKRSTDFRLSLRSNREALHLVSTSADLAPVRAHRVAILWACYLPMEGVLEVEQDLALGLAPPGDGAVACAVDLAGRTITMIFEKSMFVDLEDEPRPFLLEGVIELDGGPGQPPSRLGIETDHATAHALTPRSRRKVIFTLTDSVYDEVFEHLRATAYDPARKATLKLRLRTVEGFAGGWSLSGQGLIVMARQAHWEIIEDTRAQILIHELGHFLGMVANGEKLSPDAPAHYYTGRGHVGPHCANGVTWDPAKSTWTGTAACVMFGATSVRDASGQVAPSPARFCAACAPAVDKLDLSAEALAHVHERDDEE
jgi:hypothetical protein